MKCEKCGTKTRVVDVKMMCSGSKFRTRKCPKCNQMFDTLEKSIKGTERTTNKQKMSEE